MDHLVKLIQNFPPVADVRYDEDLWHRQHGDAFVIINCKATNIYYPEHWTPLSLKCAFSGKEFYQLRNTTYAVTPENFLLLNEGAKYASYILSGSPTESLTLNFTPYNLGTLSSVYGKKSLALLDDPFELDQNRVSFFQKLYSYGRGIKSKILRLKNEIETGTVDGLAITEILYGILGEMVELNKLSMREANGLSAKKKSTRVELYQRLSVVKDYLESCYYEDITLERMARTCYLNPFHLLREFKQLYRITPHQYLTRVRVQHAEKMIASSHFSIIHIVQEIGFQDATSFIRLFKNHYGLSPNAYRNRKIQEH